MGLKRISKKNSVFQDNAIKAKRSVQEKRNINSKVKFAGDKLMSNKNPIIQIELVKSTENFQEVQEENQKAKLVQKNIMESTENVQEEIKENHMSELTENEQTQRVQMLLSLIAFTLLANATALVIVTSYELSVLRDEKCTCKDINSLQKHEKGKVLV